MPALHDAQLVIAREQGFACWPRFKSFIVESQLDFQGQVDAFIDAAVSHGRRAQAMLEKNPKIAQAGFYVALVLGDTKQVERVVSEDPGLVNTKSGPQKCEPLLYVCFSRYASGSSDRADNLTETARVLLRHGADPNAFFVPEDLPDNPLPCLYAASGLNNNPALTLALLETGANPNDSSGQSAVAELLKAKGADTSLSALDQFVATGGKAGNGTGEVAAGGSERLLPDLTASHRTEAVRALLSAGIQLDARGEAGGTALHWACWKGYADLVELLIAQGAPLGIEDTEFHAPPSGWLHHGTQNCGQHDGDFDYAQVARLLIAAGAPMSGCNTPTGNAKVDAVLREHKLIK